jgi:hypothetical protein
MSDQQTNESNFCPKYLYHINISKAKSVEEERVNINIRTLNLINMNTIR